MKSDESVKHNLLVKLNLYKDYRYNDIPNVAFYITKISLFSKYQLIICYLLYNRYTSTQIVDIINSHNIYERQISLTSVNKQIEKIKLRLNIYSREVLVNLLSCPTVKALIEKLLANF